MIGKHILVLKRLQPFKNIRKTAATAMLLLLIHFNTDAQLTVNPDNNAMYLASRMIGSCNTVISASLNAGPAATGTFTYSGTNVGIGSGVLLTTGDATEVSNPQIYGCSNTNGNNYSDPDLTAIVGNARFDACILEFVFQVNDPNTRTITFNSIFGSEEYPVFVGSSYNDALKIFISGPKPCGGNYVKQNISNVTINTYNAGSNASQFVPNYTLDYQDIAWGGYTTRISNTFSVVPCQTYTVKIAIADAGDPALDSGVMIEDAISPCPPVIFPTASVADTCNKGSGQVTITKPNDDCHHVYAINWTNPGVVNTSTVIIPGPNGSNSTLISGLTAGTYTANVQLTILPCNTVYNYSLSVTVGNIGVGPTAAFSFTPGCHLAPVGFTDLSISLSASDPITSWDWDFDNNGTNESVLQNPAYTYPSAGTYLTRLTIRSQSGCRSSVIHTLTVNALPSAAFSVSNACVNTAVTFSNTSSAALPATLSLYNWSFGPGSNPSFSNVLSPANVSYNMPGIKTITLQVISSQSCTALTTRTVEIYAQPTASFSATSVCQGASTQFADSSIPGGSINAWAWDFTNDGSTDNITSAPGNSYSASGTYTAALIVTDIHNCRDTALLPVQVWGRSIPDFAPGKVCYGTATPFTNLTNTVLNANTGNPTTYSWNFGDGSPTSTLTNPVHTYTTGGNGNAIYNATLTAITVNNCVDVITKPINVYALPTASFTADSVCLNSASALTDDSNGNGHALTAFQWDFLSDGTVDAMIPNPTFVFPVYGLNAVSYTVSTTPVTGLTCSSSTTTLSVFVHPLPAPDFTVVNRCINAQPVSFDASPTQIVTGLIASYLWAYGNGSQSLPSPSSTTTHSYALPGVYNVTLTVISNEGCQATLSKQAEVYPKPITDFRYSRTCLGSSMNFTASELAGSAPVSNWFWDFNNTLSTIEASGQNSSYTFTGPGTQTVSLITQSFPGGCKDTLQKTVYVNYNPAPSFSVNLPVGCPEHCVTFTDMTPALTGPAKIKEWQWSLGDEKSVTQTAGAPVFHCYSNTGNQVKPYTISLLVKTDSNCVTRISKPDYVMVYPKPVAAYEVSPNPGNLVTPLVYFTNQSLDYTKWWWNFGQEPVKRDSVNRDTQHVYDSYSTGTYYSSLIVMNSYGCSDTAYHAVKIDPDFTFYIPNAFTPNDQNSLNDLFTGSGIGIAEYEMWIFDRWGAMIYYTGDIRKGWDGSIKGKNEPAKQDVYVWKVNITDVAGKKHRYVGHVTLLP